MELFDMISNTLNGAGKEGLSKAKDLKDAAKVSVEIKEREGAIFKAYRTLGKAYYKDHKDDAEFEYDEMQAIKDAFAQIGELQAAKDEIRGIKRCACCGKALSISAKFCSECGTPVPDDVEEEEEEILAGDIVDEEGDTVAEAEEAAEEEAPAEEAKEEEAPAEEAE